MGNLIRFNIRSDNTSVFFHIGKKTVILLLILAVAFSSVFVSRASADYSGPANRTIVTTVCTDVCGSGTCSYQGTKYFPGETPDVYGCTLNLQNYTNNESGCPSAGAADGWMTAQQCGWVGDGASSVVFNGFTCTNWVQECTSTTVSVPNASISGSTACSISGNNGWCRGGLAFNFSATEPVSGYIIQGVENASGALCSINAASGSCSNTPSSDGEYTFDAWAHSSFGDTTAQVNVSGKLDSTNPSLAYNVPPPNGSNGWYVSPITITVSGSDSSSGMAAAEVNVNGSSFANAATIASNGNYSVSFTTTDLAGNQTTQSIGNVKFDNTPPGLSQQIIGTQNGGYYDPGLQFAVNCSDPDSGCASEFVQIDGGGWQAAGAFTLSGGNHIISFKAVDMAGNESTASVSIQIDGEPPIASINAPAQCGGNLIITGNATDNVAIGSGTLYVDGQAITLSIDGNGNWSYAQKYADGSHSAYATIMDVGSNSTTTQTIYFVADNSMPSILLDSYWEYGNSGSLIITDNSGISQVEITSSSSNLSYTNTFGSDFPTSLGWTELFELGTQPSYGDSVEINVTAWDNCGNSSVANGTLYVPEPPTPTPTTMALSIPTSIQTSEPNQNPQLVPLMDSTAVPENKPSKEKATQAYKPSMSYANGILTVLSLMTFAVGKFRDPRIKARHELNKARNERLNLTDFES